ncbi:MAG: transposase [Lachnospiraceae bacterium]|nr:transposase [Lachnospiraceae bacterium]
MPRTARNFGESRYQHIIIRGNGKQVLFEDDMDYKYFIGLMHRYRSDTGIKICAYCLMENHVHMLLYDDKNMISGFMRKIEVSYAEYYNKKYDKTGHLFQDRFKNEVIYDERYLMIVFRYILRNPEKAGFCKTELYRWSSFSEYFVKASQIETGFIDELFDTRENLLDYLMTDTADDCMEYDYKKDDDWAKEQIKKVLGLETGTILQTYDRLRRNDAIKKLKNAGLSIRQIERLTGITKGIIQNI